MNFNNIGLRLDWIRYFNQEETGVTYIFVAPSPVARLKGESDILYIGYTDNSISVRYRQETETNNTGRNTQNTNIRTTFVYRQLKSLGIEPTVYFAKAKSLHLGTSEAAAFGALLQTWDKRSFMELSDKGRPTLEKYLLVRYANEHLELPPLNNRF